MTHRLGEINSNLSVEVVADSDFDEVTGQSTTSATLEDITGLTFDLVIPAGLPSTAKIVATMAIGCSTTGGSPATGAWAISINASDGTEITRYMSGTNDSGSVVVLAQATGLSDGTYTVKGRHRRVSGASTVDTDVAQLRAIAVLE